MPFNVSLDRPTPVNIPPTTHKTDLLTTGMFALPSKPHVPLKPPLASHSRNNPPINSSEPNYESESDEEEENAANENQSDHARCISCCWRAPLQLCLDLLKCCARCIKRCLRIEDRFKNEASAGQYSRLAQHTTGSHHRHNNTSAVQFTQPKFTL